MINRDIIKEFEENIGYCFKNKNYLCQALTHSSYANEMRMSKLANNERLEFLGDAVLELMSSENIYENNPNMYEGEMTKLRASLVCEPTLAICARDIQLGKYILLGKGEIATGGAKRDSILSDAFEAVIGAIYLDGGFTSAKEFVEKYVLNDMENKKLFFDSKTILQEIIQADYKEPLQYKLLGESGPDHDKLFTVAAIVDGKELSQGTGKTKKAAEQAAAYQAILKLTD
ncbi:MAG: ribonuclease III [Lachnospiraceae bacterium]|jgi:ribonuclease-3|nr:ribonuclease III [Lachnospiraceae bacterium]MBQ5561264.1 ribonuclease III [Lachnospiraceae bacterium]MCR4803192.1 ribonuclease III [Lachnospiraceae bacterium]